MIKKQSFSLVELLIALMAISVIAAATIPTFTRNASTNEQVFKFINHRSNSGYGGVGDTSTIVVGHNKILGELGDVHDDNKQLEGDKLIVYSPQDNDPKHSFISFYTRGSRGLLPLTQKRVGRMYFDDTNIGVGLHTLRYKDSKGQNNAAFGQYALSGQGAVNINDNTAIGYAAMAMTNVSTETVSSNTAVGSNALSSLVSGTGNTAIGAGALKNLKKGTGNTTIGYNSLSNLTDTTTSSYNTAYGYNTIAYVNAGSYNAAFGTDALRDIHKADENVAVGYEALNGGSYSSSTINSERTVAIGYKAIGHIQKSVGNIAIGGNTFDYIKAGRYNVAIGDNAFRAKENSTYHTEDEDVKKGNGNIAIGYQTMSFVDYATNNVAIGYHAMGSSSTASSISGDQNIALGTFTLNNITKGSENIAIGGYTGKNLTEGSNNIFIGEYAGYKAKYAENNIAIGQKAGYSISENKDYTEGYNAMDNILIGNRAGEFIDKASKVIGIGANALKNYQISSNTDANNIAIGNGALQDLRFGNDNIVVGNSLAGNSGSASNNVTKNVVIGTSIGISVDPGSTDPFHHNTIIGAYETTSGDVAHHKFEAGQGNVIIGAGAAANVVSSKYSVMILPQVETITTYRDEDKADSKFMIGSNGEILLNGHIPGSSLGGFDIAGDSDASSYSLYGIRNSSGDVYDEDGKHPRTSYSENTGMAVLRVINSKKRTGAQIQGGIQIYKGKSAGKNYFDPTDKVFSVASDSNEIVITNSNGEDINIKYNTHNVLEIKGTLKVNKLQVGSDPAVSTLEHSHGFKVSGSTSSENLHSHSFSDSGTTDSSYSDIRLKNVLSDSTAGLKEINAIEVKNFTFKKDEAKTPHVGVIAQQLQKIFPNAVTKGEDGYLLIRWEDMFFAMINSIKQLYKDLQALTAKVVGLDAKINNLEKQNKILSEQNKALLNQNKDIEARLKKLEAKAK